VAYLFREHFLFPHLTVLENAAFGARATPGRAREWLERLGVADLAPRHPGTLSEAERQRVALARALASMPDAVLLDRSTAALDVPARAQFLDLERLAQRESGVPFVHVAHSPAEAARVANRAVVLEAGSVVQQGPPLAVLNTPRSLTLARIAGFENIIPARVAEHRREEGITVVEADGLRLEMGFQRGEIGSAIELAIRAEEILIARREVRDTSARNVLAAVVREARIEQDCAEVIVETPFPLRVSVTPATVGRLELTPGAQVYLLIKARAIHRLE
jgi:molybdate transport system ATP-binding protein